MIRSARTPWGPALTVIVLMGAAALAAPHDERGPDIPPPVVLPGAHSAEGIAKGPGSTFYATEIFTGNIFRGDVRSGTVDAFITAPAGRQAFGLKADLRRRLLVVAGGLTGDIYVYDLDSGADLASFHVGGVINDVVITRDAAWFTDSTNPYLYRLPLEPGSAPSRLVLTGEAAQLLGFPNLNGIEATPDGRTLIVAHTKLGQLFAVDPRTGATQAIAGISVPGVDGIALHGGRLYAAQVPFNQVSAIRMSPDLSNGWVEDVITSPALASPTTIAVFGSELAVINAHFETGFPPTAENFEVVRLWK